MKTTIQVDLTTAQLLASFATPIVILAAPAGGTVNSYLSITALYIHGGVSFNNTPAMWLNKQPALGQGILIEANLLDSNQSNQRPFRQSQADSMVYTTSAGLTFQLSALPTVGNGAVTLFIVYENLTIE